MNKNYSAFDIVGPVIIGPSSSHTAGACRLANVARTILNEDVSHVTFTLYGSFSDTLKGHGTDKALLGGILNIQPDDEQLKHSYSIAKENNMTYQFIKNDDQETYANTVLFSLTGINGKKALVKGASIGGGSILITSINGIALSITGQFPTLVLNYIDQPGIILTVSELLAESTLNIATMNVYRESKHNKAYMIIELDEQPREKTLTKLSNLDDTQMLFINKLY